MTNPKRLLSALTLGIVLAATSVGAADDDTQHEAVTVANEAIAQLAGWENAAARKTLQSKKGKLGSTSEFKTAWSLLEAHEAYEKGKSSDATFPKNMSKMAKNDSADPVASYWEAELLYLQGKSREALAAWQTTSARAQKAAKKDATDATAQFYLGASLVRQKKFEPALTALRLAVRGGFDEAMVNQQIGFVYLFQQKWQDAKKAFDIGLAVNPRFAPMYYWRAMAWDKLGRKDNFMIDLDQYVKLSPKGPEAGKARAVLK